MIYNVSAENIFTRQVEVLHVGLTLEEVEALLKINWPQRFSRLESQLHDTVLLRKSINLWSGGDYIVTVSVRDTFQQEALELLKGLSWRR